MIVVILSDLTIITMSSKRCCVPSCTENEDSQKVLHLFPNPENDIERFRIWVHVIDGDILGMSNEDIYKHRRVCHAHFEEKYCCRYNRISNTAVPTLHMPGPLSIPKFSYTNRKPYKEISNLPSTSKDNGDKETADVLLFFDNLFDSVNGSFNKNKHAKPLLGPLKPQSKHHKTWIEAKNVLKSIKFVTAMNKLESVPSISNWVWTLEGLEKLVKILKTEYNITSFWTRHLNQDPIENLFGAIRSHGCRNTNPTPERFESALTTLLFNSLTSVHAPGANCEEDSALHCMPSSSLKTTNLRHEIYF